MIACKAKRTIPHRAAASLKEGFALAFPGFHRPDPSGLLLVASIVGGVLAGLNLHWQWPFMALLLGGLLVGGIAAIAYWIRHKLSNWIFAVGAYATMFSLYGLIAWAIR